MKDQFQSTEALKVRFPPFIDKTTGDEIIGTDTCTIAYKKPDTTLGSASGVWDSDMQVWTLDIAVGSYMQGEWRFKAESDDPNARTQRKILQWGDYVNNLDAAVTTRATQAQILSDATPFAGAKLAITGNVASSAEVLALQNNTSTRVSLPATMGRPSSSSTTYQIDLYIYNDTGEMEDPDSTPTLTVVNEAGTDRSGNLTDGGVMTHVGTGHYRIGYAVASTHAVEQLRFEFTIIEGGLTRLAGAATNVLDVGAAYNATDRAMLTALHTIGVRRWKVDATANTLTVYEADGTTPAFVFDLLGSDGNPNPHLVYERVPV